MTDRFCDNSTPKTLRPRPSIGLASCRCCRSEIPDCVPPPGLPSLGLWPSVVCCCSSRLAVRLNSLPARDLCGESDPQQRGGKGVRTPVHLYPPRWRTSAKKGGVALTISTPPVRRAAAPAGRGTREAQPPFSFPWRTREIRVIPRLMQRFGEVLNHNGGGSAL